AHRHKRNKPLENTNTENKPAENPVPEPGPVATETASAEGAQPAPDPCRQQVTVEIPAEEVSEREEALVQQYSKQARVPGFRKGKVPASVVRSRFAEQLREELLERMVPEYFRVAVMSGGYKPISAPSITDLKANPGEAIRFTASFDPVEEDRPLIDGDFAQVAFTATPKEDSPGAEAAPQPKQAKPVEPEDG